MASVRKREWDHNGETKTAWVVEYTDQAGKRRRFTPKSGLKRDAEKERLRIEIEVEGGVHTALSNSISVLNACQELLLDDEQKWKEGYYAGSTRQKRKWHIKMIGEYFGNKNISELTSDQIGIFIRQLRNRCKERTVADTHTTFQSLLRLCVRRKWVKRNILIDDPVRVNHTSTKAQCPTRDEIRRLVALLDAKETPPRISKRAYMYGRLIVCIGLFTGLRRGEVAGLQWDDIDFDGNTIHVRHSYSKEDGLKVPKSKAGVRDVPMPILVAGALREIQRYFVLKERVGRECEAKGSPLNYYKFNKLLDAEFHPEEGDVWPVGYVFKRLDSMEMLSANTTGNRVLGSRQREGVMGRRGIDR